MTEFIIIWISCLIYLIGCYIVWQHSTDVMKLGYRHMNHEYKDDYKPFFIDHDGDIDYVYMFIAISFSWLFVFLIYIVTLSLIKYLKK